MADKDNIETQEAIERMKSGSDFVKKYIKKSLEVEDEADLPSVINGPTDDVSLERLKKRLKNNEEVDGDE